MNRDQDSISILCVLESIHGRESRGEVMDVEFQPIGRRGYAWILKEMLEGIFRSPHESSQCPKLNGVETEDVSFRVPEHVRLAQIPLRGLCPEVETAIPVENPLLTIGRRESLMPMPVRQLQADLEITQQMNMTSLMDDPAGIEDAPEAREAVCDRTGDDETLFRQGVQQIVIHFARLTSGTESACDQTGLDVPDEVLAEVLPLDGQGFCIHEDDTACMTRIEELQMIESVLHVPENGRRT